MLKISSLSDGQIIDAIYSSNRKESRAIQHLLDENRRKINSYILKNGGNESDAETVLVEGVSHLIMNIRKDSFRGESSLGTYLFSICRGVWLKTLRKEKRYVDFDETKEKGIIDAASPLDFFSAVELKNEMNLLLGQIGDTCKSVLKLWSEHYSMTEISKKMSYKNAQIAMNKKNKCLGKLKEIVKQNSSYREQLNSYLS